MDFDRDGMMNKIQGLLSKTAENGASEQEAMSAMAAAQRLMDKYNIGLAEVFATDGPGVDFAESIVHTSKSCDGHWLTAIQIVEMAFAVKTFHRRYKNGYGHTTKVTFIVYGDRVNVENAEWAVRFLARLLKRLWDDYRKANPFNASWAEMNGFYLGVRLGFKSRLAAERAATEQATPGAGTALVLVQTKLVEAFDEAVGKLKNVQRRTVGGHAHAAGRREGENLQIRRPIAGSNGTKAIG